MSRKVAIAIAATLGIVLLAAIVDRVFLRRADQKQAKQNPPAPVKNTTMPTPTPPDASVPNVKRVVTKVTGKVERLGSDGNWQPLAEGSALNANDRIRTKGGARAVLTVDNSQVVLDENTNVTVSGIAAAVSEVRLKFGRVTADMKSGKGRRLLIKREGSDLVATTPAGRFSMLATKRGDTVVASDEGSVEVTANKKTVTVNQGEQTTVAKGKAPTAPQKIPTSLFLKLYRSYAKSRVKRHVVRGKTLPFARITVNGIPVRVSSTGEFSHIVALKEGYNEVKVTTQMVTGRTKSGRVSVSVDTSGPKVKGGVEWGK